MFSNEVVVDAGNFVVPLGPGSVKITGDLGEFSFQSARNLTGQSGDGSFWQKYWCVFEYFFPIALGCNELNIDFKTFGFIHFQYGFRSTCISFNLFNVSPVHPASPHFSPG